MGNTKPSRQRLEAFLESVQSGAPVAGLTHRFYRYPARFSPVFAKTAIETFTSIGDFVLDPFMGGGTSIVEALAAGRRCVGSDINQLSKFITRVKTTPLTPRDRSLLRKWIQRVQEINLGDALEADAEWQRYQKHVPWWLRKVLESALDLTDSLPLPRQQEFARCSLMRTAQWALDCKSQIPTKADFLEKHLTDFAAMVESMTTFADQSRENAGTWKISARRRLLIRSAADLSSEKRIPHEWGAPRLVLTSPPYAGVHVLYHRWQIQGRRETPAPYWISGSLDGQGASFYTFGPRRSKTITETYLQKTQDCFSAIASLLDRKSHVVQLVGYSDPEVQLPLYLATLRKAGLREVEARPWTDDGKARISRPVPNRKWYADIQGDTPGSTEFLLVHRKR